MSSSGWIFKFPQPGSNQIELNQNVAQNSSVVFSCITGSSFFSTGPLCINTQYAPQKWYSLGQSPILSNESADIEIVFANGSFACKVVCVLTQSDGGDVGAISTLSFQLCGGTTDNTLSVNQVVSSNITEFHSPSSNTNIWSLTLQKTTNSVTLSPSVVSANGYMYSISIDFIAHNPSSRVIGIKKNNVYVVEYNY